MSELNPNTEWSTPQTYKIKNEADLVDLANAADVRHIINPIDLLAEDMFELRHPELMDDNAAKAEFTDELKSQGPAFGRWAHYPWMNSLVRVAEAEDHYDLRTYRNRNLITKEEQTKLHLAKVAAFGLSVGSNVVDRTVQSGIGNEYLLFDYDRLGYTNLNRIQAGLAEIGLRKTTIAGRKIAELDPYIAQQHFTTGYDRNTDDILRAERPDIIIEEVDNLEVKARLRKIAAELAIPLVMAGDVGDRSTLDIERHDRETVAPFNGKLSAEVMEMLASGTLPPERELEALVGMLGEENISLTLFQSVGLKGKELAGTPQLGTAAAIGGALTSVAAREILLGRDIKSHANVVDAAEFVGAAPSVKLSNMRKLNQ